MKTAIVTGGSRGIGRAAVEALALNGFNVIINYKNSAAEAEALSAALLEKGGRAVPFRADVSVRRQVDEMTARCIELFGGVHLLVNNAAIAQTSLFTDISEDDWDTMMSVNLKGVFNCCQSVIRDMISRKSGKIINISSIWGITGASCEVGYSAAKAGVIGMTKALAKELAPSGIMVNCIAPGIIETDMLNELSPEELSLLKNETPAGRLGTPADIASCILYLADEKNDFLTGQVISPNGGYLI